MNLRQKLSIAAAVFVIVLLIPIPYLASPDWTVRVTDEAGHPLAGILVRLSYENYSVENTSHEVDVNTDANGLATFSAKKNSASLLSRCYYTVHSAMALAHASFGPSAYVLVFGNGRERICQFRYRICVFLERTARPAQLEYCRKIKRLNISRFYPTISVASRSLNSSRRRMSRWLFPSTNTSAGRKREL